MSLATQFILCFFISVTIVLSLPISKLDEITTAAPMTFEEFCDQCPLMVEDFLSNGDVEKTVFSQLCEKIMHSNNDNNPMVKVCVSGFLGEMFYVRDQLKGKSDEDICSVFGCIYTPTPIIAQ